MQGKVIRFVGGMMGLIGLSLLVGCESGQVVEERDALWTQNEELQRELNTTKQERDSAVAERDRMANEVDRLKTTLENQPAPAAVTTVAPPNAFGGIEGIETTQDANQITVRVPGDVLFAPGKVALKEPSKKTLAKIAEVIRKDYGANKIRVEGYTDTDPIKKSKWSDNLELSLQRAAAVYRYLQQQGIKGSRMEAVGLGEWHPRSSKATSRRVEIVVVLRD
jgi:flagellar motor protein MotB